MGFGSRARVYVFLLAAIASIAPSVLAAPQSSLNSSSSPYAGFPSTFSLFWTADAGVSGFVFSFDNGSGFFENGSWAAFNSSNFTWANASRPLGALPGTLVRWMEFANDSNGAWNASQTYLLNLTPAPVPLPLNWSVSSSCASQPVNFSSVWSGPGGFSSFVFSVDGGSGLANYSATSFTSQNGQGYAYLLKRLPSTAGQNVSWRVFAFNSLGISNSTPLESFNTTGCAPANASQGSNGNGTPTPVTSPSQRAASSSISVSASHIGITCPYTTFQGPLEVSVNYFNNGAYSCDGMTLEVRDQTGRALGRNAVSPAGCSNGRAEFYINATSTGDYLVTAFASADHSVNASCSTNYRIPSIEINRVPEFSPPLAALVAIVALGLMRMGKKFE